MAGKTRTVILADLDLWSLLNGYGPEQHGPGPRRMTHAERTEYLFQKVKAATEGKSAMDNLKLVLEIT